MIDILLLVVPLAAFALLYYLHCNVPTPVRVDTNYFALVKDTTNAGPVRILREGNHYLSYREELVELYLPVGNHDASPLVQFPIHEHARDLVYCPPQPISIYTRDLVRIDVLVRVEYAFRGYHTLPVAQPRIHSIIQDLMTMYKLALHHVASDVTRSEFTISQINERLVKQGWITGEYLVISKLLVTDMRVIRDSIRGSK